MNPTVGAAVLLRDQTNECKKLKSVKKTLNQNNYCFVSVMAACCEKLSHYVVVLRSVFNMRLTVLFKNTDEPKIMFDQSCGRKPSKNKRRFTLRCINAHLNKPKIV